MMTTEKIRVAISQGDINGIGLETVLKTFAESTFSEICTPVLFSSQKTVNAYKTAINIGDQHLNFTKDINQLNTKKANVLNCYEDDINLELGHSTPNGGKYALLSLSHACKSIFDKKTDILVTAPINKNNIQGPEFQYKGHTDYLDAKFADGKGKACMMMVGDKLKVALVTEHLSVKEIANHITTEKIAKKLDTIIQTMKQDFGISNPKIAVLGLNPHAGDNGTIGKEDNEIILPAIQKAFSDGKLVFGPYPADGFFATEQYNQFDVVLAMYHDQGLIPFKMIHFEDGVNYTAGLSIIRTSPDHGTAYDIAGKGIADPSSFKHAVYLALDIYKNRKLYQEITANPLAVNQQKRERDRA